MAFTPRYGRLPNDASRPRVRLRTLTAGALLAVPASVDWHSAVDPGLWGMDGNAEVGDCTYAEVDHSLKAIETAAGNAVVASTADEVLAAYAKGTGWRADDPSTDQGAEMQNVRADWRKGIRLGGAAHTIALFAEVDARALDHVKWAVAFLGPVGLGINCPTSALDQFNAGDDWTVVPGSPIDGGHAISLVGYDADWAYVVSWGRVVRMSWGFFHAYVEEAWTQLDTEWVSKATGHDPLAVTLYDLGAQFESLTGQPNPFPQPGPAPIPTPGPTPPNGGGDLPFLDADPALARWVDRQVRAGRYPDRTAVVMHALRRYSHQT